jgi:sugar phosphate isomerase/epimerase
MTLRIACHLCGWPADVMADPMRVLDIVRDAGYDGVEGMGAQYAEQLVELAAAAAQRGLKLINVGSKDFARKVEFNATLGNDALEVPAARRDPSHPDVTAADYDRAAEELAEPCRLAEAYGLLPFHHIHVWTMLETVDDCRELLARRPELRLLYDTGHSRAANDDPMGVLAEFPKQIGHVHLKNFYANDPSGWDHRADDFWQKNRFCDLREGNTGIDIGAILDGLAKADYTGWVSVEEDHPQHDIIEVVTDNRKFIRELGY